MSDEAGARNEFSGAVAGSMVQARSIIGNVTVHSPPMQTPAAMFSMRGDIPHFVGRNDDCAFCSTP